MKVRGIQFSPALGDISKNLKFHNQKINQAVKDGIDLIIFPELSLSGYHLKDILVDVALNQKSKELTLIKEKSRKIDIVVGAPMEDLPGIFFNTALCFSGGKLVHMHKKVQLPNFGMFEEEMIFKAGNEFKTFRLGEFTVGMVICREILFPEIAYLYFLQGVDFLIGISNSPHRGIDRENFISTQLWEKMGYMYSVFYHQNYVFINRTGFEDGIGFTGGSFFARPGQGIVKMGSYLEADILDFNINLEDVRKARIAGNYLRDSKPEVIFKELKRILNV